MKVCILGGRGREHALAWTADKVGQKVDVVPVNAAIPWHRRGPAVPALRCGGIAYVAAGMFLVSRTPNGR